LHLENGYRLHRALVDPARGHLRRTGDTDFQARRIGQVNIVGNHAVLLTPRRLATRTQMVVTELWFHDAHIALGQTLTTAVTITLRKTFFGFGAAGNTVNVARVREGYGTV